MSETSSLFDPSYWFGPKSGLSILTGGFTQPILPGWHIGDTIINQGNSSSPATERKILAEESYGRQIGRLLDAVCVLVRRQPDADTDPAFKDLIALQKRIEAMKTGSLADHLARVEADLERLKAKEDPKPYNELVAKLRAMLPSG